MKVKLQFGRGAHCEARRTRRAVYAMFRCVRCVLFRSLKKILVCFFILTAATCREVYVSPVDVPALGYLVVEGFINAGRGPTSFTLSRVSKFTQADITYEKGAVVQIEGEDNAVHMLSEKDRGLYVSDTLALNTSLKYRLRIKTMEGKEYVSAFEAAKKTPPIDSISWKRESKGVQISLHTHDDQNNSRYYRWEYIQNWEFHATYLPNMRINERIVQGQPFFSAEFIDPVNFTEDTSKYRCWGTAPSTNILLGSSARLSKDVINQPLIFIQQGAVQISVLYSILVKQHALTAEAYAYFEKMKKNTELTGSIFDAQSSQLAGNMSCLTHPGEPVIGYISVASAEEKVRFIHNSELPAWGYNSGCYPTVVENQTDSIKKKAIDSTKIGAVSIDVSPAGRILSFVAAPAVCVDCTILGSKNKPSFWP